MDIGSAVSMRPPRAIVSARLRLRLRLFFNGDLDAPGGARLVAELEVDADAARGQPHGVDRRQRVARDVLEGRRRGDRRALERRREGRGHVLEG